LPIIGMITCLYLVTPISGRDVAQYVVAGWLLLAGGALFGISIMINRRLVVTPTSTGRTDEFRKVAE
jgi:uncharacterized membrane protein